MKNDNAAPWTDLTDFGVDDTIQPRRRMSRDAVARYAQVYRNDPEGLPPVKLGRLPSGELILVDGFHRVEAAKLAGIWRLRAETVATTEAEAPWLAVEANIKHGVPIPRTEKRAVFRRFVKAGRNRRADGFLMSSRQLASALPIGSHSAMLIWMREDFPAIHAEMVGEDYEEPTEDDENVDIERDQAIANVDWAERQLVVALAKARKHVTPEELAYTVRCALRALEEAIGRPARTLEELLDMIHDRVPDEEDDF